MQNQNSNTINIPLKPKENITNSNDTTQNTDIDYTEEEFVHDPYGFLNSSNDDCASQAIQILTKEYEGFKKEKRFWQFERSQFLERIKSLENEIEKLNLKLKSKDFDTKLMSQTIKKLRLTRYNEPLHLPPHAKLINTLSKKPFEPQKVKEKFSNKPENLNNFNNFSNLGEIDHHRHRHLVTLKCKTLPKNFHRSSINGLFNIDNLNNGYHIDQKFPSNHIINNSSKLQVDNESKTKKKSTHIFKSPGQLILEEYTSRICGIESQSSQGCYDETETSTQDKVDVCISENEKVESNGICGQSDREDNQTQFVGVDSSKKSDDHIARSQDIDNYNYQSAEETTTVVFNQAQKRDLFKRLQAMKQAKLSSTSNTSSTSTIPSTQNSLNDVQNTSTKADNQVSQSSTLRSRRAKMMARLKNSGNKFLKTVTVNDTLTRNYKSLMKQKEVQQQSLQKPLCISELSIAPLKSLDTQKIRENFRNHLDSIRSIDFHKQFPYLISVSEDSTARIWAINGCKSTSTQRDVEPIQTFRGSGTNTAGLSPLTSVVFDERVQNVGENGDYVSLSFFCAGLDGKICAWNLVEKFRKNDIDFKSTLLYERSDDLTINNSKNNINTDQAFPSSKITKASIQTAHNDSIWDLKIYQNSKNSYLFSACSDSTVCSQKIDDVFDDCTTLTNKSRLNRLSQNKPNLSPNKRQVYSSIPKFGSDRRVYAVPPSALDGFDIGSATSLSVVNEFPSLIVSYSHGYLIEFDIETTKIIRKIDLLSKNFSKLIYRVKHAEEKLQTELSKLLACACDDKKIRLVDLKSPRPTIESLNGHDDSVTDCDWSIDRMPAVLASSSHDCSIKVWDTKVWRVRADIFEEKFKHQRKFDEGINCICQAPNYAFNGIEDSMMLASGGADSIIRLYSNDN